MKHLLALDSTTRLLYAGRQASDGVGVRLMPVWFLSD